MSEFNKFIESIAVGFSENLVVVDPNPTNLGRDLLKKEREGTPVFNAVSKGEVSISAVQPDQCDELVLEFVERDDDVSQHSAPVDRSKKATGSGQPDGADNNDCLPGTTTVLAPSHVSVDLAPAVVRAASARHPVVLHVAAAGIHAVVNGGVSYDADTAHAEQAEQQQQQHQQQLVLRPEHSEVLACVDACSGSVVAVASASVEEAADLAALSHAVARLYRVPVVHLYDAAPDAVAVAAATADRSGQLPSAAALKHWWQTAQSTAVDAALSAELERDDGNDRSDGQPARRPLLSAAERARLGWSALAGQLGGLNSNARRTYAATEYVGSPTATVVVVALNTASAAALRTHAQRQGSNIGFVSVRLWSPFPAEELARAIPSSARAVAVVDVTAVCGDDDAELVDDDDLSAALPQEGGQSSFYLAVATALRGRTAGGSAPGFGDSLDELDIPLPSASYQGPGPNGAAAAFSSSTAGGHSAADPFSGNRPSLVVLSCRLGPGVPAADPTVASTLFARLVDTAAGGAGVASSATGSADFSFGLGPGVASDVPLPAGMGAFSLESTDAVPVTAVAPPALSDAAIAELAAGIPPYDRLLQQAFGDRLVTTLAAAHLVSRDGMTTAAGRDSGHQAVASDAEYALGLLWAVRAQRRQLATTVARALSDRRAVRALGDQLAGAARAWLTAGDDAASVDKAHDLLTKLLGSNGSNGGDLISGRGGEEEGSQAGGAGLGQLLPMSGSTAASAVRALQLAPPTLLRRASLWLAGASELQRGAGLSAVHAALASGENVNILVVETASVAALGGNEPMPAGPPKKDVGLYAMNFGGAYVASIASLASYTQALQALREADDFAGPSVIIAYAPEAGRGSSDEAAGSPQVRMMRDSKQAVDTGLWPLYRWDPRLEAAGREPFQLDSEHTREELRAFVDRHNQLTLLANELPSRPIGTDPVSRAASAARAHAATVNAFGNLAAGLGGEPLLVGYASDGGNAEECARKMAAAGSSAGLAVRVVALDELDLEALASETTFVAAISTAGQGEMPGNGASFWRAIKEAAGGSSGAGEEGSGQLEGLRFGVFGLGDRHYWPGELQYFCKPAIDLDAALANLGGTRMLPVGLGDDQEADGFNTAFKPWAEALWTALGVDAETGADDDAARLPPDDEIKRSSKWLRGTIAEQLQDRSTGGISPYNAKLTKFHGIYLQDNRDVREQRRRDGLEKAYSFLIRVGTVGGVCSAAQWRVMDDLASAYGGNQMKLTTRQAFQLHGVLKRDLKLTIASMIRALLTTLAACGDVSRNVMCCPAPPSRSARVHEVVQQLALDLSRHFAPRTPAYYEIFLDKKPVAADPVNVEPLYGETYLPRKFKVVVAVPPSNDVDVYAHCLGYVAIVKGDEVVGYTVLVGGGMGMTHNNEATYPCLAQPLGFVTPDQAVAVGEAIMLVQRDNGDRHNRKHARLKYTLRDMGMDRFKAEVERRCGFKLKAPEPFEFSTNVDKFGWQRIRGSDRDSVSSSDYWNFTMFVENGRVRDNVYNGPKLKTGLRAIADVMGNTGEFRLTPNQHLIISKISSSLKPQVEKLLAEFEFDKYGVDLTQQGGKRTGMRVSSIACAALPQCALAFAESERWLPGFIDKIDRVLKYAGLEQEQITIRSTGCPNGCARPYLAEIGLVGRAPGIYNLYLGGSVRGNRLSKLYKPALSEEQIMEELEMLIHKFARERHNETQESFGDWVIRAGTVKETIDGPDFHANVGPGGQGIGL